MSELIWLSHWRSLLVYGVYAGFSCLECLSLLQLACQSGGHVLDYYEPFYLVFLGAYIPGLVGTALFREKLGFLHKYMRQRIYGYICTPPQLLD
jgi:hypothetical protein